MAHRHVEVRPLSLAVSLAAAVSRERERAESKRGGPRHSEPGRNPPPRLQTQVDRWGEGFSLGGLGGLPFAGKSGFRAYLHHCPDNGKLLVMFAPHVGNAACTHIRIYSRAGTHTTAPFRLRAGIDALGRELCGRREGGQPQCYL